MLVRMRRLLTARARTNLMMTVVIILLSLLFPFISCSFDVNNYQFNAVLAEDAYWLYWNFSNANEVIKFAVKVKTTGWIGFGLSPNGQMTDSDVVIGWINEYSEIVFHDRYAFGHYTPPIDPIQNWFVTNAEQQNGYTVLEFYRKFITCDELDREILLETARVVYSWNDNFQPSDDSLSRHTNKGSTSINLLGGLPYSPDVPEDAQTFTIAVQQVEVPSYQTTYWCAGVKLDSSITEYEKYIIKVSPYITSGNEPYVHHMLVYVCDGLDEDSDLGQGGNCDGNDISNNIKSCLSQLLIGAWAVGGSEFTYPEHVAYPIGGPNEPQFVVIQIHYNNLNQVSGIVDSSGFVFTYTDTARQFNAGILFFGHAVTQVMIVPPNTINFTTIGICPSTCTKEYIPSGGIHILANMLHTHLAGSGLKMAHINETDCSGTNHYQELKPIEKNIHYDFNFQQATHLPQEITIQPGDILLLECYYNTTSRNGVTMGGESTLQEMCLSFPVYYPRLELGKCVSLPLFDNLAQFINNYVPDEHKESFYSLNPDSSSETLEYTMNLLEWTQDQINGYQKLIYSTGLHLSSCGDHVFTGTVPFASCCSYEASNICTGNEPASCCQRKCVTGAVDDTYSTTSDSLLILILIILVLTYFV